MSEAAAGFGHFSVWWPASMHVGETIQAGAERVFDKHQYPALTAV
jgi:hypothetical protein